MNLYRISQTKITGYDTYSDAVVCAACEADAKQMHPRGCTWVYDELYSSYGWYEDYDPKYGVDCATRHSDWPAAEHVQVELIGTARDGLPAGVVCASFHAG